jgi:hypothetical protein
LALKEAQATRSIIWRKPSSGEVELPAGEKLPDPLTDPSFASFASDDAFKKAVARMTSGRSTPLD